MKKRFADIFVSKRSLTRDQVAWNSDYVVVNKSKKNPNHDQYHHELNQGHDIPH